MMEQADQTDWTRFCDGERAAMGRIFNRHKDTMFTYCLYMTGDRDAAEDLVQDAFARLIAHGRNHAALDSVKNWLFICTRNLTLNHLKRKAPAPAVPYLPNPTSSPEACRFVERVLDRLAPDERELILMREKHRYPVGDIAAMLGISPAAARVRLYRVRKKLQRLAKG